MKKIPLSEQPAGETSSELSRYFLTDALETLLLGALWVFVLLWVPFYQDMNGGSLGAAIFNEAVFVQFSLVALLSVALLAMGWQGRAHTTKQKTLLVVVALVSVAGWFGRNVETVDINHLLLPGVVFQAILGLAFFLARR